MEYAIEAIKLGSTAIGICTPEGVVLGVEKRITSPLMITSKIEKIFEVDKHIGLLKIISNCRFAYLYSVIYTINIYY